MYNSDITLQDKTVVYSCFVDFDISLHETEGVNYDIII